MYVYDDEFYQYLNVASQRSATGICTPVTQWLSSKSVVDFGCGQGAWLSVWKKLGAQEVAGLDGPYIDRSRLLIEPIDFHPSDLSKPIDLGRRFDLVMSVEVAEHLPESAANTFVDNLVRHGDAVLFSAALPGQLGEHHVNEQPFEYWRDKFSERGFVLFDPIRPRVQSDLSIEVCYRHNCLLFVHKNKLAELPAAILATRVAEGAPIRSYAPIWFRTLLRATSKMPVWMNHGFALLDKRLTVRGKFRMSEFLRV